MLHSTALFMKLPSLSLTTKIVMLIASMGIVSAMLTAYATWHTLRTESQYHLLIAQQATVAKHVGTVRQQLSSAAVLVHKGFSSPRMSLQSLEQLQQLQQAFEANLKEIYPLLTDYEFTLDQLLTQSRQLFSAGRHVLRMRAQTNNDHTMQLLTRSFTPAFQKMHDDVQSLRAEAHQAFEKASANQSRQTAKTIRTTLLASWLSIFLMTAAGAWMAWRLIARPIGRLTASMQSMRHQHYDLPIADQHRSDEIGEMARSLKSFAASLQENQKLEATLAKHQHNALLTEEWQKLSTALPGAVFQMNVKPGMPIKLRFVSPQWTQLMGLPADADPSVEHASAIIRHHDHNVTELAERHYRKSAETLEPLDFSVPMEMMDGVTRWIQTRANPFQESDGSTTFNGVWLDVTKDMMQSRALEKAKRQAEQSAAEKSMLQASISHEIRTPLNAILGMTQLLLKADLPEVQREQLHHILNAGQHLRGIVNEVLDFSKIDAGQLKLESTDFSLERVVLDVLSMCHEEASKKGLSINYKMAREVPDSLRGDPHRIAQILLNYVNNAIKFTTSGHIHIALRLDPSSTLHRIVLYASVTDTGPGIPADRIPLLFEAFQQADNTITRRFGGTGLGLTISRALAQLMGGSAGVESILGQGSTFWFPAVLEPARTPVLRAADTALLQQAQPCQNQWKGLRILVVDDNPLNRAVAEGMLHALGLLTETAEDGAQALDKLQAVGPRYFDCVLMDIQMPQMDGLSATQAIRQLEGFAYLPIIAMTAHTAVQDVERTQAAGMNAHLSKPLLESALHQVLQEWLCKGPAAPSVQEPKTSDIPPVFDHTAIDALAQLFDPTKLHQLIEQFTQDTLQRAQQLPALAQQHHWQSMRGEVHKLTGTAATFGLMQVGHWSAALSSALKASDSEQAQALAQSVLVATQEGIAQLQAYAAGLRSNP